MGQSLHPVKQESPFPITSPLYTVQKYQSKAEYEIPTVATLHHLGSDLQLSRSPGPLTAHYSLSVASASNVSLWICCYRSLAAVLCQDRAAVFCCVFMWALSPKNSRCFRTRSNPYGNIYSLRLLPARREGWTARIPLPFVPSYFCPDHVIAVANSFPTAVTRTTRAI